jgi:hypothetical protein
LAEAVAQAHWPRDRATAQLEPHRDELLRLRQAGESVGSLVGGLRLMGVEVGHETLRLWLNRKLGRKPARRNKPRVVTASPAHVAEALSGEHTDKPSVNPPTVTVAPDVAPPIEPGKASQPVRQSSLIRPGETPLQALRRRLAALDAEKAAAKVAVSEQLGPRIARDIY